MPASPNERRLAAQVGAHSRWAAVEDRPAATAAARAALTARFEADVDPDGVLDPAERARRADNARQAHMARMSLRSSTARRKAKELLAEADAAEAERAAVDPSSAPR